MMYLAKSPRILEPIFQYPGCGYLEMFDGKGAQKNGDIDLKGKEKEF